MQIITVSDVPSQTLSVVLANQACQINLYVKSTGMYCDVYVSNQPICTGIICQNLNRIVRAAYTGFVGDLCWQDTQGTDDPTSPGLGTRYLFCYLESSDVATIESLRVGS